jgi:putative ATP-dependent endonuclease of OLD family
VRILQLRIENFRSFKDETICFDNYTCFVGPNGAGKSTILTALNIFFRETENVSTNLVELSREDFHQCNTSKPVRITVTFDDLNDEAKQELHDYVRQDMLIVSSVAEWSEKTQTAPVLQFGERLGIEAFRRYFDLDKSGAKAADLKEFYSKSLKQAFADLPAATTKPQMEEALHNYEVAHPDLCVLIPSADQFYGVSRGANKIEKYLQWVYVPAVKDASAEQVETKNSAIGKLLARRVHSQLKLDEPVNVLKSEVLQKYEKLLEENEQGLKALADSLNKRFHEWAHDHASLDLQWQDQERAVTIAKPTAEVKATEGLFKGDLARFGHGLQRSFIFALLQELSEHANTGPRLVLGCEEPELYQHPPQARHLATVLQKLSTQNAEVLICTHSPYFVSGKSFESVRLAAKDGNGCVSIKQATFDDISQILAKVTGAAPAKPGGMAAKIEQEMESPINEMFFASLRVFVEGLEDVGYISSYLSLLDKWDDFRSLGGHLIPVHGKNHLIQALAIANRFELPYFVVFDCDGDTPADDPADPKKQTGRRTMHERENLAIFQLAGLKKPVAFPDKIVMSSDLCSWPTELGDVIDEEIGKDNLMKIEQKVRESRGINVPNMGKNGLFIGYVMAEAWEQGLKSKTLIALCEAILTLGKSLRSIPNEAKDIVATSTAA